MLGQFADANPDSEAEFGDDVEQNIAQEQRGENAIVRRSRTSREDIVPQALRLS